MMRRRPRGFGFDRLEDRQMLSAAGVGVSASAVAKGAVMPYEELTLKGHFFPNDVTDVTFTPRHGAAIVVRPASIGFSKIVVTVPAFFDAKTGQPIPETVAVSVQQKVGGREKSVGALKNLAIARLPQTGLLPGDVLGAVTVAASSVTSLATASFTEIGLLTNPQGAATSLASGVISDLQAINQLIPLAQQQLVALAYGQVASAPLGTFQGRTATLDAGQLGQLDRIFAAGINDAAGTPSTGVALVGSLENLISQAEVAGPSAVVDRALDVIGVLDTTVGPPVIPAGAFLIGEAVASISAVVAAAAAEALVVQGAFSPTSTLGPADLALVDQVLDDKTLIATLNAIDTSFVPTTPAGVALLDVVETTANLANLINPAVPGSTGAQLVTYLGTVPLHGG